MVTYAFSLYNFEFFLAILVRTASFLFTAPVLGMQGIPARVKVGLAFFFSVLLYTMLPMERLEYGGVISYSIIVVKEVVTGLILGFMTNLATYIIGLAGQFIDQHIGFSMAMDFNPMTQSQIALTGNLYYYLVLLLLLVSGLDHYLISAFVESYQLIPVNGQIFQTDMLLQGIITFMTDLFILAFRIALPVFACIMILNSILGIMAKVAPQMNMFSIGMQLKVLTGFLILFFTVQILPRASDLIFTEIRKMAVAAVEGMY